MLAGKFAMAFVYCSLAWLDVSIFIFLHLCAEGIAEKVRTALVIDLFPFLCMLSVLWPYEQELL